MLTKPVKDFLRDFRNTAREAKTRWKLDDCGSLRCRMGKVDYCPITYLVRKTAKGRPIYEADKACDAAEKHLNLEYMDIGRIMGSADSRNTTNSDIRRSLLRAVGLKERNTP